MVRMNNPKIEVVRFSEADIIVASTATSMTVSGLRDATAHNATFVTNNGQTYINDGTTARAELYAALSRDFNATITGDTTIQSVGGANIGIKYLLSRDDGGTATRGTFDGVLNWDSSTNSFIRN